MKQIKRVESGSSLSVFRTCPKRYEFEYERLLSTKGYPSAMGLGSLVHGMVEDYRKGGESGLTSASTEFSNRYPDAGEQVAIDMMKAKAMFGAWKTYWEGVESDSFGENNLEFLEVETEWAYPLDAGTHVGKRDGYLKNRKSGKHYLYELKTSAASGEANYIHRLSLDHQISANIFALKHEGKPVEGVLYDIIFKPLIRLKKNETMEEFADRYYETMLADPETYFKRLLVDRMPKALAEYNEETTQQIELIEAGYRYRNTSACMKFGSLCPFFNLCMDPNMPELELEFNKRTGKFPELREANVSNKETQPATDSEVEGSSVRPSGTREDNLHGVFGESSETPNPVSGVRPSIFA